MMFSVILLLVVLGIFEVNLAMMPLLTSLTTDRIFSATRVVSPVSIFIGTTLFRSPMNINGIISMQQHQDELLWGTPNDDAEQVDHPHLQRRKRKRDYDGYDPDNWLSSSWYTKYVQRTRPLKSREENKFRRRFRMPRQQVFEVI
jgi:hypothetical protein